MAKVLKRVARKDYPADGIKKGDEYFKVSIKTGPRSSRTMRSKTGFKRSQLTTSSFLSSLYTIEDETIPAISCQDDIDSLKSELEDLKSECEGSLDNIPDSLKEGATGQLLQERIDNLDNFINELDSMDEIQTEEEWDADDDSQHESYEDYVGSKIEEVQGFTSF